MARLALAGLLFAAIVLASWPASATPEPATEFSAVSIPEPSSRLCHFTSPPLVISPSHTFVSYHCFNPEVARVAHVNLVASTPSWTTVLENTSGIIFNRPLTPITTYVALVFASGPGAMAASVNPHKNGPDWVVNRYNSPSDCVSFFRLAFLPMGPHMVGGVNSTSLLAVDLGTGATVWEKAFSANAVVGTPVAYEGRVIVSVDSDLWSLDAFSGGGQQKKANPCNIDGLGGGQQLNVQLVTYGADINGLLNALILYADSSSGASGSSGGSFTLCRVHHGNNSNFGVPEWVRVELDPYQVFGISGGGGAIFVAQYNVATSQNSLLILNGTSGPTPLISQIMRTSKDKYNVPAALFKEGPPLMAYTQGGVLTAVNIASTPTQVWQLPEVECARAISVLYVGSTDRGYCVPYQSGNAVSFNYNGTIIWQYPNVQTMFPAIVFEQTGVIFFEQSNSLVGVSADASTASPSSSSSAGLVVLIIFIGILIVLLSFWVGRSFIRRREARRVPLKTRLDDEGYAGLNP